ncbi:MAG: serine hydrolase domain-containing protein [Nonlabens sp.]
MKLLLYIFLSISFISCQTSNSSNDKRALEKETIKSIDTLFSEFNNLNSPGFAIGIIKDSTVLYKTGYGTANLDHSIPIDNNTAFDIASVSKQFTAACIALLIIEGKVNLNAPAQNYIPELSKYQDTIRIKHLMYNTSGLTDYFNLPRTNKKSWLDFHYFDTEEAIKTSLRQDTLSFTPGDKWDYSNVNFMLLTKVVEKISGMSFTVFIKERLFNPLEMKNTLVNDDITTIIKNRATPYNPRNSIYVNAYKKEGIKVAENGDWIQHNRNSPHYGGSGIISTIDDLIKWEQNFFNQKYGGTEFYSLMHQTMQFNHDRKNQAFGLYFGTYKERNFVAWEGATSGISSQIIRFPDQKVAIIVLSNLGSGAASNKANLIADILIKASEL